MYKGSLGGTNSFAKRTVLGGTNSFAKRTVLGRYKGSLGMGTWSLGIIEVP